MREIKFRAWDKVNKKMLHHFLIDSSGGIFIIKDPMLPTGDDFGFTDIIPSIGTIEIVQYTGLKDKNGKEIYEGDILRRSFKVDVVIWDDSEASFTLKSLYPLVLAVEDENIEVIGNIYENPELLKEDGHATS